MAERPKMGRDRPSPGRRVFAHKMIGRLNCSWRNLSVLPTKSHVPGPGPADTSSRLAWSTIALLAAIQFSAYVDRAIPAVTAPLFRLDLGLSDSQIGLVQGPAYVVLYVVGLLAAGNWARRFRPWRMAFVSLVTWTAGAAVFALAGGLTVMLAGRALMGAGQAAFVPAALALVGGQADAARRARGLSLFTTASAGGRSGALLLGGLALAGMASGVAGLEAWRAASLALIAPNMVLACLVFAAARRTAAVAPPVAERGLAAAFAVVRRRPAAFLSMAAVGAACVFVVQAAGAWLPSVLNRSFALGPAASAAAFGGIVLVFAPLGHLSAGWLLASRAGRREGPARYILAGLAVVAVCAVLMPAAGRVEALVLAAGLTAAGGLTAASALIGLQAMTEQPLRPAMGSLFYVVISVAGVAGGPWFTGLLSDLLHAAAGAGGLGLALAVTITGAAGAGALLCLTAGRLWRPLAPEERSA